MQRSSSCFFIHRQWDFCFLAAINLNFSEKFIFLLKLFLDSLKLLYSSVLQLFHLFSFLSFFFCSVPSRKQSKIKQKKNPHKCKFPDQSQNDCRFTITASVSHRFKFSLPYSLFLLFHAGFQVTHSFHRISTKIYLQSLTQFSLRKAFSSFQARKIGLIIQNK